MIAQSPIVILVESVGVLFALWLALVLTDKWSGRNDAVVPDDDPDAAPKFSMQEYLGGEPEPAPLPEPEPEPPTPHTNTGWDNPHGANGRFVKRPSHSK